MYQFDIISLVFGAILARFLRFASLVHLLPNINRASHRLWVGGENHPCFILSEGFDAVVDLRIRRSKTYETFMKKFKIKYLKRGIPNGLGMPPKDLQNIVEWVFARVKGGEKVLIHCSLGRGRACLVAVAYLVYLGMDLEYAIMTVKKKRPVTYLNKRQRTSLQRFSEVRTCE